MYQTAATESEPLLAVVPSYDTVAETTLVTDSRLQVFKRRWYVLVLFSLVYMTQSAIWNTWGPLTQSVKVAFGWSLDDVALLTNWGCIMYVASMAFFSWLMDVKGMVSFILVI